jgi:hypothetical protein
VAYQDISLRVGGIAATQLVEAMNGLIRDLNSRMILIQGFRGVYALAGLPPGSEGVGWIVYVSDALKVGELPGAGTGTPAYYSNGAWRTFSSDQPVRN